MLLIISSLVKIQQISLQSDDNAFSLNWGNIADLTISALVNSYKVQDDEKNYLYS